MSNPEKGTEGDTAKTQPTRNPSLHTSISSHHECTVPNSSETRDHALDIPYHVFSARLKRAITLLVSCCGMLSGLSTNIYFPAQVEISRALGISQPTVNLSITTYIIFQGLAPSFWSPLSDALGRRKTLIATLTVYVGACVALALTQNAAMLLTFRAVQAIGSSSTISLGAGIIADISPSSERGAYLGWFSGLRQVSVAFGPTIGGLLAGYLGFRSIFWFLVIVSAVCLLCVILFLPETLRRIAGNGSTPFPSPGYKPLIYAVLPKSSRTHSPSGDERIIRASEGLLQPKPRINIRTFLAPFWFLFQKDVGCALFFGACFYAAWSMMVASTTYLLVDIYDFSTVQVGLAFLANGIGCVFGSIISGHALNATFRTEAKVWQHGLGYAPDTPLPQAPLPASFPLERARLSDTPFYSVTLIFSLLIFGWSLTPTPGNHGSPGAHWIAPLLAQFAVGYSNTAVLNSNNTLLVDLYPSKSASASAVINLSRCGLAAIGVALSDYILDEVSPGWYATILVGLCCVGLAPYSAEWVYGMKWRGERETKLEQSKREHQGAL